MKKLPMVVLIILQFLVVSRSTAFEIYSEIIDWEEVIKYRQNFDYTEFQVIDYGYNSGNLKVSVAGYYVSDPSIYAESTTSLITNGLRKDDNADGVFDFLDPKLSFKETLSGTEVINFYQDTAYAGTVNLTSSFEVTREADQDEFSAIINATVTKSNIESFYLGQTFTVENKYYLKTWSGYFQNSPNSFFHPTGGTYWSALSEGNSDEYTLISEGEYVIDHDNEITFKSFALPSTDRKSVV